MPTAADAFETPATLLEPLLGLSPHYIIGAMNERVVVTVQDRGRVNLGKLVEHERYLGHTEPDGTIVLEPAEVISLTEKKLLTDSALMTDIAESRSHPERLVTRDRSRSPRA